MADAVVSLCRLGAAQTTVDGIAPADTVELWLVDADGSNLDVPGVLAAAASVVADLRREGKTVLLHCVHAQSRTSTVAAAYGALVTGDDPAAALARVVAVLPSAWPRASLVAGLDAASDRLRSETASASATTDQASASVCRWAKRSSRKNASPRSAWASTASSILSVRQ
ncbi:MAG: hypothetical protein ABS81_14420 [Pseudonocardia sp. SCN 72-86]|nr:MAG: hypothetical protein ABS81_14420 [Pseudonocardia sp. SCN 72-86]